MYKQSNFLQPLADKGESGGYSDKFGIYTNKLGVKKIPQRCGKFVTVGLPILGFMSILFGTTMLGISVYTVGEHQVGYYQNGNGYFGPGVYVQFPWKKSDFIIIDIVSEHKFVLWDLTSKRQRGEWFTAKMGTVTYRVSDVELYVTRLQHSTNPIIFAAELTTKCKNLVQTVIWHDFIVDKTNLQTDNVTHNYTIDLSETAAVESFGIQLLNVVVSDLTLHAAENPKNKRANKKKPPRRITNRERPGFKDGSEVTTTPKTTTTTTDDDMAAFAPAFLRVSADQREEGGIPKIRKRMLDLRDPSIEIA